MSSPPEASRKERGAIAAQACETCRSRKQKCDEKRPKCGTCQRFNLDCYYRDAQPTKKDKTLLEILDRLGNIEEKIDSLNSGGPTSPSKFCSMQRDPHQAHNNPTSRSASIPDNPFSQVSPPASDELRHQYRYGASVFRILSWPEVRKHLQSAPNFTGQLPSETSDNGISAILSSQNMMPPLEVDGLESVSLAKDSAFGLRLQQLSRAYFDTYNFLHPIMDRQIFSSEILPRVLSSGFDEGMSSSLACLVFALGELAIASAESQAPPYHGRISGFKNESAARPPGLEFFNEAMKRVGYSWTDYSIENIQLFSLTSVYYQSIFRHREFWRMTTFASLACQALIRSKPAEIDSSRGDIIKRAYWHCYIMETCLHMELELPPTGLNPFEDHIGLPDFSTDICEEDHIGNQASHYQEHFASQIVLRRLSENFNSSMRDFQD